jgi:hypothetical protein
MKPIINAILFDVGGTLRFTEKVDGRETQILEEIREFLDYKGTVDSLKNKLSLGEKEYRKWAKKSLGLCSQINPDLNLSAKMPSS